MSVNTGNITAIKKKKSIDSYCFCKHGSVLVTVSYFVNEGELYNWIK